MVTSPTSDLLKKSTSKWEWTQNAELTFQKLPKVFTAAPIQQHYDLAKPMIV